MNLQKVFISSFCALGLAGLNACGSSSTASTAPTSIAGALSVTYSALNSLDGMLPDNEGATPALNSVKSKSHTKTLRPFEGVDADGSVWSTKWMSHPQCSGGADDPHCADGQNSASLKEWMGYQLDPEAKRDNGSSINIFGRINSSMDIFCALGILMTVDATTGYPAEGTQTITFSEANVATMTTQCNMDASGMTGLTGTATITVPTDTTYYDRKVVLTAGDGDFTFYFRFNATGVNIVQAESTDISFSRTVLAYDAATKVIRAEYASAMHSDSNGGGEFGRLYYDATNDNGAVLYSTHDFQDTPNRLFYTLRGKPKTGTEVAFSARATGFGLTTVDAGFGWNTIFKSCVNQATGDVATDDTVSCAGGVTGTAADDTGVVATMTDVYSTTDNPGFADWVTATQFSATTTLPFTTADEVYSAVANHD